MERVKTVNLTLELNLANNIPNDTVFNLIVVTEK